MRCNATLRSLLLSASLVATLQSADGPSQPTPLVWKPTSKLLGNVGTLDLTAFLGKKIAFRPFTDSRKEKGVLGENQEKGYSRYITTSEDVPAFVLRQLTDQMKEAGLPVVENPAEATVVLSADLLRFSVIEKQTYEGELRLLLQARVGDKVVWQGMTLGKATRFGRSYKLENYHEVLSDTVIDLLTRLLTNDVFMSVLAGKAMVVPVPAL
jgi:hypothetical protein